MVVLLHVCCGPCSLMPAQRLWEEGHELTGLFVNPNIQPLGEYLRRREAAACAAERLGLPMRWQDDWDLPAWIASLHGRETHGPDHPAPRCELCYAQRLDTAARIAARDGFDAFTTSLLYSRYQSHERIARLARAAAQQHRVQFLYRDFRPDWRAGIDRSKDWGLYRQNYCGCIFSEAERLQRKLERLRA